MNYILSDIKKSIQKDNLETSFSDLIKFTKNYSPKFQNEAIVHLTNYNQLINAQRLGVINFQDIRQEKARIINAILDLIDKIDESISDSTDGSLQYGKKDRVTELEYPKTNKNDEYEEEISHKRKSIEENPIRILHLSDLHLKANVEVNNLVQPLFVDLEDKTDGIGIDEVHYLVITGDLTNCASKEEFQKAEQFCKAIKERFRIPSQKILIVPGNHDLDWDENVYEINLKRRVDLSKLESGKFIEDNKSVIIRKDNEYPNRFKNFSNELYRATKSESYPLNFNEQCIPIYFQDDKVQFILMNSSWEIDEHFPNRSGIFQGAVSKGLLLATEQIKNEIKKGRLKDENETLKIACWHHPITGNEKIIQDDFMENIQKDDIKLCLHGHVHEERADLLGYLHPTRRIHVIGAGSFDAPSKNRPESIPRIYNLLEIRRDHSSIRVHTRCKLKKTGAWCAWAVWPGEKYSKRSYYDIQLKRTL